MSQVSRRPALATALAVVVVLAGSIAAAGQAPVTPPPAVDSPNACLQSTGSRSWCGDDGPADRAKLAGPSDVATAPDGSLLVADTLNNVVRRVRPDGTIVSIAGTGAEGSARSRRAAARARFDRPEGVAMFENGGVLVADTGNDAIRAVSAAGVVTTLVSAKGPAHATLRAPGDVTPLPDGGLLVADTGNHRVLRVSGTSVEVLAGTGRRGYSGDGGPATEARLRRPSQIAVAPDGSVLIADTGNGAVRRVLPSGVIETVTGGLAQPRGVLALPDGTVVVTSSAGVHRVLPGGTRERIAGGARQGFNGDRRPRLTARFDDLGQLTAAADGRIVFAERGSDRIRALTPGGDVETIAGSGVPVREPARLPFRPGPPQGGGGGGGIDGGGGGGGGGAATSGCEFYNARFATFTLVPITQRTLRPRGRTRLLLRFKTSRRADVVLELFRGGTRIAGEAQNAVGVGGHRIRVGGSFRRRTYRARLWGRSVGDRVVRCDVKSVRVR
jgi:hypothetical protein